MKHPMIILAAVAFAGAAAAAQQSTPKAPPQAPAKQDVKQAAPKAASGPGITRAHADIKGEGITGVADLVESQQGTGKIVMITVTASGLKPGMHGVHLHAVGKCTPDFAAAGGHFDPGPSGNPNPDANHPFHMGDIPQLNASPSGKATMRVVTTRVTLSPGPLSLFDDDGSAIIIHGNEDQMKTGEAGSGVSGGPRVACGVIEHK